MLWIALHLPLLSLESFAATLAGGARPAGEAANAAGADGRTSDRQRQSRGAGPRRQDRPEAGHRTRARTAADARAGRSGARDAQALEPIAHAALAFTPSVVIQPADVARCCAAHGAARGRREPALLRWSQPPAAAPAGISAAAEPPHPHRQRADAARRARCSPACIASCTAPTSRPTGRALESAPVGPLGPGREHWDALQGMGLQTLGDLRSVPRAGLARRFGEGLLNELDRALGVEPDPRVSIVLPSGVRKPPRAVRAGQHDRAGAARREPAARPPGPLAQRTACLRAPLHSW